jgi:tetratricopeptide (TPR) repeat protein
VRDYAIEQARRAGRDPGPAFQRVLRHYTDTAVAVDWNTGDRLRVYDPGTIGSTSLSTKWLAAEWLVWPDLIATAHRLGWHVEVTRLCGALELLINVHGEPGLYATINQTGIRSAEQLGDARLIVRAHATQGRAYTRLHRSHEAFAELAIAERTLAECAGEDIDQQQASSVFEFQGDAHADVGESSSAIAAYRRSVAIDETLGDHRALSIHARKLASALGAIGQFAEAIDWLNRAEPAARAEASTHGRRNLGRLRMVQAEIQLALGGIDAARLAHEQAQQDIEHSGSMKSYWVELKDIAAQVAFRSGDIPTARSHWESLLQFYLGNGHPRSAIYQEKLNTCGLPDGTSKRSTRDIRRWQKST